MKSEEMSDSKLLAAQLRSAPLINPVAISKYPIIDEFIEEIVLPQVLAQRKRVHNKHEIRRAVRIFILNVLRNKYSQFNPWCSIDLDKNAYKKFFSRYDKFHFTYDQFKRVYDELSALGYLVVKQGHHYTDGGFKTRIKASEKLVAIWVSFNRNDVTEEDMAYCVKPMMPMEFIHIKDSDKNLIEYADTEEIYRDRVDVRALNYGLVLADDIRLGALPKPEGASLHLKDLIYKQMCEKSPISYERVGVYRVFNNGGTDENGRFNGAWYQNLKRELRPFITINGWTTIELDYSCHHPRLLYILAGKSPSKDADLYGQGVLGMMNREHVKNVFMRMINCSSKEDCLKASLMYIKGATNEYKQGIMGAIEVEHPEIRGYFYTGYGNLLMKLDSELAKKVMEKMYWDHGINVVLCIHDSFIVKRKHRDVLKNTMIREYKRMFGANTHPLISVKKDTKELPKEAVRPKINYRYRTIFGTYVLCDSIYTSTVG